MRQWFGQSDSVIEALHDMALFLEFAQLVGVGKRLPHESAILTFCYFLEAHQLAIQIAYKCKR